MTMMTIQIQEIPLDPGTSNFSLVMHPASQGEATSHWKPGGYMTDAQLFEYNRSSPLKMLEKIITH